MAVHFPPPDPPAADARATNQDQSQFRAGAIPWRHPHPSRIRDPLGRARSSKIRDQLAPAFCPIFVSSLRDLAFLLRRRPRVRLGGARSGAGALFSSVREPVILTGHVLEVLFRRGRRRISSQLSHARRVLAVVIRR